MRAPAGRMAIKSQECSAWQLWDVIPMEIGSQWCRSAACFCLAGAILLPSWAMAPPDHCWRG